MPDTTPFPAVHHRRDPWQDRPDACVEYQLRTDAEADVLCRLLGRYFGERLPQAAVRFAAQCLHQGSRA